MYARSFSQDLPVQKIIEVWERKTRAITEDMDHVRKGLKKS